MAIPFLRSLRNYLDGELWAIGKANAVHIYRGLGLFDRFTTLSIDGVVPFLDTTALLRKEGFVRGILLPHSFRSAFLFYMGRMEERIGYARNQRGFMLTNRISEGSRIEPTVEHYLKIIDTLGGRRLLDAPLLTVTDDEDQKFDERFPDITEPFLVFVAGAQYGPAKCWPETHFSELADMVADRFGMNMYILPGKGEEEVARKIYEGAASKDKVRITPMDMRDLKVCLSRARAVVTNDTGPRHLAAALSVPTIVLLGPMDEAYTAYPSPYVHTMKNDVPCRPCNKKKCSKGHECLKAIAPKDVFMKLGDILEDT